MKQNVNNDVTKDSPILCLGVNPFPSRLFIEGLSGEVSHAHSSKTQSIECIVLRHIPTWSSTFSTLAIVLKIKLLGKGLTWEISGDRGSCCWAPGLAGPRPHVSGYFWIRNFFFPDSPSGEFACKSATFWVRSLEWIFLNPQTIWNRVYGRIRIFFNPLTWQSRV